MILLTGATGTIGRATMAALRAANAQFKVAARNPADLHALGVPSVIFDWDQLGSYLPALQGVDRLFLLTPNSERQVGYILQAVAAARRAGVRQIVRVSVMGADAEPGVILGRQHAAADRSAVISATFCARLSLLRSAASSTACSWGEAGGS